MEVFFTYLFKSSLLIALFWGCSQFFLQRETFFQQHRLFLIFGVLTSLAFPFITITKTIYVAPVAINIPVEDMAGTTSFVASAPNINWWAVFTVIYLVGVVFMGLRFCIQLFSLRNLIKRSRCHKSDRFTMVETTDQMSPFSFFNYIVYNPSLYTEQELKTILAHEQVHSHQKHSLDIMLIHFIRIFQWVNPFIWGYKKMVAQNLEYIADQEVGNANYDKKEYQYLLLRQSAAPMQVSSIGNPFFNSLIKKRIVMLNKNKSNKGKLLKFSIILPLLAVFLFTLNTKTVAQSITVETTYEEESNSRSNDNDTEITAVTFSTTINKNSTDESLAGHIASSKKLGVDLKFQGVKRNNKGEIISITSSFKGPEGNTGNFNVSGSTPIQSFRFYTKMDGEENIQEIGYGVVSSDTHVQHLEQHFDAHEQHLKNTGKLDKKVKKHLDNHKKALFQTHESEESHEGTVEVIQTTYTSDEGDTQGGITIKKSSLQDEKDPLYVVNGTVVSKKEFKSLYPSQIVSINVLKGKKAKTKYGEKGLDGVVEITVDKTKKVDDPEKNISLRIQKSDKGLNLNSKDGKQPLFIIDGKKMKVGFNPDSIDPDIIESVSVIKGEKARKKYGKEGKDGVVVIKTKNKK